MARVRVLYAVFGITAALGLSACARSSVLPIANNIIEIKTNAAAVCGQAGAQDVAVRRAAIEAIQRGFDRFMILDAASQTTQTFAGYAPTTINTTGTATATRYGNAVYANGQSTSVINPGGPQYRTSHNQGLLVKLFNDGDPAGLNAISARSALGPNWKKIVTDGPGSTC